ncbi:MAG: DNA mismatch repair endonuclease MutL [Lachnospiraceae bacterium]|nr:DNA mismatch repair endonuclease MutL [Lachnospiraceae bacterium]
MEIKLLTEETISRISAGEVIERPLNVVKELVENSIDAGSTAITVEIRDGGITMIRVTDNGCGIEKDQITRAFVRHATSKITDADDLSHLSSLGFRGEALASIAAVAQVEMITKVRSDISGTRAVNDHLASYSPDEPVRIDLEEIGAPDGTTVIVRNLFGKIPVRRKFLRQPQTEAGYITDLIEKQALSHPLISFHYRVNGQDKLHTTGNGNLRELIYRIYGRETAGSIIPVHAEDQESGMVLDGFLGRPEVSRSSRSFETFFINGRMLRSKELSAGLEEGYRTDLMQHRFPFAVLHLTMPPEQVDVNVHPSKMEVRFTDRRAVFRFLETSVHEALRPVELIPKANLNTAREERAQTKKEAQLKQQHLQNAPHYEAFEKGRTDRMPVKPSVSSVEKNSDSDAKIPSENSQQEPVQQSVLYGSGQIPALPESTGESSDFIFEDRRSYGRPNDTSDKPKAKEEGTDEPTDGTDEPAVATDEPAVATDEPAVATDEPTVATDEPAVGTDEPADGRDKLPAGQLTLENLFAASTATDLSQEGPRDEHLLTPQKAERFKYIGQVFGTYWIIEYEKRLLIIDQHAAHEKVNYERMMRRIEREHPSLSEEAGPQQTARQEVAVASQQLMPPIVLRLSGREETAYQQFQNVFAAMGYEIEEFGGGSYAIRAVPTELFGQTADSLLREILEEIMNERISGTPHVIISKVASMACKAAVKGNSRLSEKEARALIDELLSLENPYHCPHGRPTMIVMTQYEMDRKFKRIV